MDEKLKGKIFVVGFVVFFIAAAFFIANSREGITGNVILEDCDIECNNNKDCDDYNKNTLDGCLYPGSCASICVNEKE